MDLFRFYNAAQRQYWFLEMHSLPMADELRSLIKYSKSASDI